MVGDEVGNIEVGSWSLATCMVALLIDVSLVNL